MKIHETRIDFKKGVEEFMNLAMDKKIRNHVLLVGLYTGSGKTYGIREALETLEPTFIYLSPRHDVIEDNFWKRGSAFPHLMSRSRFLDKERTKPYCLLAQNDPRIMDLLKMGKIDVSSQCSACKYYAKCDYWKTRQIVEMTETSWMGVHAHIPSYLSRHFIERDKKTYDLIVIDENPFTSLFEEEMIVTPHVTRRIEDIITFNQVENSRFMYETMKAVRMMLVNGPYERYLEKALEFAKDEDLRKFIKDYNEAVIDAHRLPFKNIPSYSLVRTITGIFDRTGTIEKINQKIRPDTFRTRKVRIMDYRGKSLQDINRPMIILDATASVSIWKTILGTGYYFPTPILDKWRHRHVTHFKGGGEFYKTSWEKKLSRDETIGYKILKRLCMVNPNGVLMTGHKTILNKILKRLEKDGITNARAIWHYGLTSDNNFWENCDTIVVTSKPVIPPVAKEMYSDLTGLIPGNLDYIFTEAEIVQAIGRVRQAIPYTSPKLPEGELIGEKIRRHRNKVQIIVFPQLESNNPFDDPDSYSTYHYARISPYSYYKNILGRGYVSVLDCKTDIIKKLMKKFKKKSDIRYSYPFRDFDTIFNYLIMSGKIEKMDGEYEWIKN